MRAVVAVLAACGSPASGTVDGAGSADAPSTAQIDAAITPPTTGVYLLYERFDAMTTGAPPDGAWTATATNGAVVVREIPFAADKSASIEKTAGAGTATLGLTFPAQSGYAVWLGVVAALYLPCRWFGDVKARRRDWWLGYL